MTPVRATWLGVSTVLLDDGETALMTDGFLSRPGRLAVALGRVRPDVGRIAAALERAGATRLAAVVPLHAHYDHAMDAATVARFTGARVLGSPSVRQIARGHGLPEDRFGELTPGEPTTLGRFTLTAVPARHTPGDLAPGRIERPVPLAARARRYRTGECISLHVRHDAAAVVVHASTNAVPGALAGSPADVLYLGIALLGRQEEEFRERYWHETVTLTGARRVVPVHWDDFTRSLDRPLRPIPRPLDDVAGALAWLRRRGPAGGVEVTLPRLWKPALLG